MSKKLSICYGKSEKVITTKLVFSLTPTCWKTRMLEDYSKSDIVSIKARHSKMPEYPVYVRFKNEPDVVYLFTDLGESEWKQLDILK